ncbi:hypothetical protein TNCT_314121 [Trichonephila clavata]|uniref:Uncharacterized protein n=1 Tax=Trichonephila clavata TaxID=2740835 RepID=A0A8X6HGR9_TRICU|nr:hypothetical protein TNCT_314121 [Trichonephila clavata]
MEAEAAQSRGGRRGGPREWPGTAINTKLNLMDGEAPFTDSDRAFVKSLGNHIFCGRNILRFELHYLLQSIISSRTEINMHLVSGGIKGWAFMSFHPKSAVCPTIESEANTGQTHRTYVPIVGDIARAIR